MNLQMGTELFLNVEIPLLWGQRAVVQDRAGTLSVIDLGGKEARLEVLGDKPAPGVEFIPADEGFIVRDRGRDLYQYTPSRKELSPIGLNLVPVRIERSGTWVGSNFFTGNVIRGSGVGLHVIEGGGMAVGAPLPAGLAKLSV
jgi:hypothetical protein